MKKRMLRQLRNQYAVAVCIIAMAVQFILMENYVNAEVRTAFSEYNNNFVWMYAIFFALGGLVCVLSRLRNAKIQSARGEIRQKDFSDVMLALWGVALVIVAFLSVGFVQTLLPDVPVGEISSRLPLVYALILCACGFMHYALFSKLFSRVKEDGASLLAPICIGIIVSMVALIIIPRQISYKSAIVMSGALLVLGALLYAKSDTALKPVVEVRPVERTNDTSGALTLVLLGMITFGMTFLFVNIDSYAAKLQFDDIEIYLLIGFCAGGAYAGNAFFKKFGRVSGLWSVIDFVVLIVCMFTVCFVREYIALAFLILVASVCFAVIIRDILANIKNWDKMRREGYRYLIITAGFIVPLIAGYAAGTAATQGHGYMTDIFAGVNSAVAEYALRARGAIAYADGSFAKYIGVGARIQLADGRYEYVPTRYLPMVTMACMLFGSLFYMISQVYNIRTSVNDTSKNKSRRVNVVVQPLGAADNGEDISAEQIAADVVRESAQEKQKRERQAAVDKAMAMSKDVEFEEVDDGDEIQEMARESESADAGENKDEVAAAAIQEDEDAIASKEQADEEYSDEEEFADEDDGENI